MPSQEVPRCTSWRQTACRVTRTQKLGLSFSEVDYNASTLCDRDYGEPRAGRHLYQSDTRPSRRKSTPRDRASSFGRRIPPVGAYRRADFLERSSTDQAAPDDSC
jgi:hypothetical protein